MALFLLDKGADPDKTNMAGRSARQIALKRGLSDVFLHMNFLKPHNSVQQRGRTKGYSKSVLS